MRGLVAELPFSSTTDVDGRAAGGGWPLGWTHHSSLTPLSSMTMAETPSQPHCRPPIAAPSWADEGWPPGRTHSSSSTLSSATTTERGEIRESLHGSDCLQNKIDIHNMSWNPPWLHRSVGKHLELSSQTHFKESIPLGHSLLANTCS